MKHLSLYLFLILFTLQTPSWADDIRDFQIEGISVGDSLLDHFTEEEINNRSKFYYKKKYAAISFGNLSSFEIYDAVQLTLKLNDKKFKIYSVEGFLYFRNNMKNCYRKQDKIVKELSSLFKNTTKEKNKDSHAYDKSGESISTDVNFFFSNGGSVRVICTDWSEKLEKTNNWIDVLKVILNSKEFSNFLRNEAYE